MMTRVSLGHTGRTVFAGPMTLVIYAAVLIAVLARICAAFESSWGSILLQTAGGAWPPAFFLFAVSYGLLLAQPRVTPRWRVAFSSPPLPSSSGSINES